MDAVVLAVACAVAAIMFLVRSQRVLTYKLDLIDRISDVSCSQVLNGMEWEWRFEEFNSVSYYKMLFVFWKPLGSFYDRDPAREER